LAAGLFGGQSLLEIFFSGEIEVGGDFGGEIAIEIVLAEEIPKTLQEREERVH
jgi:hypothetical protein